MEKLSRRQWLAEAATAVVASSASSQQWVQGQIQDLSQRLSAGLSETHQKLSQLAHEVRQQASQLKTLERRQQLMFIWLMGLTLLTGLDWLSWTTPMWA